MAAPTTPDLAGYLGITGDYSAYETELGTVLSRATTAVERWTGPHGVTAWTRRLWSSGGDVYPGVPALVTCDTVTTQQGDTVTAEATDPVSGVVITACAREGLWTFAGTHGHADGAEPPEMTEAVLALARHWWGPRAGLRQAQRTDGAGTAVLGGYAIPRAVVQLIQQVPGGIIGVGS